MARSGRVFGRFALGVVGVIAALAGPILLVIAVNAAADSHTVSPAAAFVAEAAGVILAIVIVGRMSVALGWSSLKGLWVAIPVWGWIVALDIVNRWALLAPAEMTTVGSE